MEIPKITASQRIEMIMKGLSPLNQAEVDAFLRGYGVSPKDKQERVKLLVGEATNLGGSHEREMIIDDADPDKYIASNDSPKGPSIASMRQRLNEELDDYVSTPTKKIEFDTDGLMGFKTQKKQQSSEGIMQEGFNYAKDYLNAFVSNLQESEGSTSYVNRMKLYKSLKLCLEAETKYKENPQALKNFRAGVLKAEKAMLQKLQG